MNNYDYDEIIIPDEALKLPIGDFIESYRELYNIMNESNLREILELLKSYEQFISELTQIRNKHHKPEYLHTWDLNEPGILHEIWEATKKLVPWDGKERRVSAITFVSFDKAMREAYIPALEKAAAQSNNIFTK